MWSSDSHTWIWLGIGVYSGTLCTVCKVSAVCTMWKVSPVCTVVKVCTVCTVDCVIVAQAFI